MWLPDDQDPRTQGNPQGEKATYVEYLANYRLTLGLKCDGLTPEQLATRSVPPSTMSLLGLVRHMARVENNWFQRVALASGQDRIYWSAEDDDLDFNAAEPTQECVGRRVRELAPRDRRGRGVVRRRTGVRPRARAPDRRPPGRRGEHPGPGRAHDRGVRAALRPRRPAARVHRRKDRPVSEATELPALRRWLTDLRATVERKADGPVAGAAGDPFGAAVRPVGAGAGPAPGADGALLVRADPVPGRRAAAVRARRRLGRAVPRRRRRRGRWSRTRSTPGEPCAPVPTRSWTGSSRPTWSSSGTPTTGSGRSADALIQVLYEYSRHCGHLDLLREAIDGQTGE